MAHDHEGCTLLEDVLHCGKRSLDSGVVRDDAVLQRNVEIDADEDSLAFQIGFVDCIEFHKSNLFTERARLLIGRPCWIIPGLRRQIPSTTGVSR